MSRLVVVSNRVAPIDEGRTSVGGLAVAVLAALQETGGIWFGWSGEVAKGRQRQPTLTEQGDITYATLDLTQRDVDEYYNGFSNSAMWPLLHFRLDLTRFNRRDYLGYMRVNDQLARTLLPLIEPDDTIWVHDYHLIPFARALRQAGATNPIGWFLHTPFPPAEISVALPRHDDLMKALCSYDLVGFQTDSDLAGFRDYIQNVANGQVANDGTIEAFGRRLRAGAFPIGLDTADVVAIARRHDRSRARRRLQEVLQKRRLIVGVDRLDYSKGLAGRFQAYSRMLEIYDDLHRRVSFMQVAPPSRSDVHSYAEIRAELETSAGHINGLFADFDWVPLHYLNRSFSREMLTCFYREAKIGLVTPLRDGMNLVAKEYVAAQDPDDPGVLVLSQFAGAAAELTDALIVNPHDTDEVANAMYRALGMPLRDRKRRWRRMMDRLTAHDIHHWRRDFLDTLARTAREAA